MDRNEFSSGDSTFGQSGGSTAGSGSGSSGFGGSGSGSSTQGFTTTGGSASPSTDPGGADHGFSDRARDIAGTAQEKLSDVGSSVRERAGALKDSLADALTSGADRLRHRGASAAPNAQFAGATGEASVAVGSDSRVTQVTTKVATGMDATADWLRDADLAGLRTSIETQVKEHPGRTLLIAAGLGYLLGKALRK
jgi:ElaB/YqjD/DUF883 family membrane-anchored ribosome-binding protein